MQILSLSPLPVDIISATRLPVAHVYGDALDQIYNTIYNIK